MGEDDYLSGTDDLSDDNGEEAGQEGDGTAGLLAHSKKHLNKGRWNKEEDEVQYNNPKYEVQ